MGYAQYGSRDGFPVVNAHGGLACRLDVAAADGVAAEAGVRLISPDRPGVGLSDPQPGRTILDWARDVAELLDQIDVERFAVMGWSMGGQYAAAVGHALHQRVTRVAIVAGALPLTEPGVFDELPAMDRFLTRMCLRAPWLARTVVPDDAVRGAASRQRCTGDSARVSWDRPTVPSSATKGSKRSPGCHTKRRGNRRVLSRSIGPGCARGDSRPRSSPSRSTYGRGRATNSSTPAGRIDSLRESPTPP